MDWIEANGASLRYELSGGGSETVVLIHEVGGLIESWDDAVGAFQRSFRVLRYDQRGFGLFRRRWVGNDPAAMAAMLRMSTNPAFDLSADLARITAPTLVIGCTHDGIRTPDMVAKAAAAIPGARYVEANTGHFMAVETPDLFTELAVPFLKGA